MTDFRIFEESVLADRCYLKEVVLWCAFGRPPPMFQVGFDDWRVSKDIRDSLVAPIPFDDCITPNETQYAGLHDDPRYEFLRGKGPLFGSTEQAEEARKVMRNQNFEQSEIDQQILDLEQTKLYQRELQDWLKSYSEYVDEFQTEILLDLRRGELEAYGTKVPSNWLGLKGLDNCPHDEFWQLSEKPTSPIPKKHWVSTKIDWDASSLKLGDMAFIWVHFETEHVIARYPPSRILESETFPVLGTVFFTNSKTRSLNHDNRRGRKPFEWDAFHVEVARLYSLGMMPEKKEAAIQLFIEWFDSTFRRKVGRTVIGNKLKPYYDVIQKS